MLKAVIVDDERKSRENLEFILSQFLNDVMVVEMADGVSSGIKAIKRNSPDLVFLDIELSKGDGFQILEELDQSQLNVIFVTAHEEHAIKAFRSEAVDYLLKPVDVDLLKKAVDRVKKRKELIQATQPKEETVEQISLSTSKGLLFLKKNQILYCRGDGAYTYFFMKNGDKITTSKNLKSYEGVLNGGMFFRTHKSFLINLQEMKKYVRGEGGHVIMSNGDRVSVSKRRKENFIAALG